MSNADDNSGLRWIKDELGETIQQARHALESYVEGSGDPNLLETCSDKLHQSYRTLQMVQLYGAAMLAEEMEKVSRAIQGDQVKRKAEAAEALMLGLVQLPDYLEKLQAGGRDMPLVIMPLLNDLRAARDARLLTEASLFKPKLDHGVVPEHVTGIANPDLPGIAKRLRINYHRGLIGWYRNVAPDDALGWIRDVTAELESHARTEPVHNLFWASHALVEGLMDGGIAVGSAVKSLFGRLDREIKRIVDGGETELAQVPDKDLLKSILYYVAGSKSSNAHVSAVQAAYQLTSALPSESEVAAGRARLSAPSADAIDTVRDVIQADLTQIKDKLDLYIRGDHSRVDDVCLLEEPMRKLGDTLGMVGQGALRVRLTRQADRLAEIAQCRVPPDEAELMKIAGELLFVETSLTNVGNGMVHGDSAPEELSDAQAGAMLLPQGELGRLIDATLHEAHIDMARAKEAIIAFLDAPEDPRVLADVPARFHSVAGALRMLSLAVPADMLDAVAGYVAAEVVKPSRVPEREQLDALADAITSIEYFMESAVEGNKDRDDILGVARIALARLGVELEAREDARQAGAASPQPVKVMPAEEVVDTALDSPLEPVVVAEDMEAETESSTREAAAQVDDALPEETVQEPESAVLAGETTPEEIDPEILEVFIEEAQEELAIIQQFFVQWQQNPGDTEARARLRRSFHTLKGSGRLVGAKTIGELAWAAENLLNRLIEDTIGATAEILEIINETVEVLPRVIEHYVAGGQPVGNVDGLIERAFAAADPDRKAVEMSPVPEGGPVAEDEGQAEAKSEPESGQSMSIEEIAVASELEPDAEPKLDLSSVPEFVVEPELLEIFRDEANAYLASLDEFVSNCRDQGTPLPVDDTIHRVLHTLRGSANTTEVPPIAELSKALEDLVEVLREQDQPADRSVVDLLDESVARIRQQLAAINMPGVAFPDAGELVARIETLREQQRSEPPVAAETSPPSEAVDAVEAELPQAEPEHETPPSLGDPGAVPELAHEAEASLAEAAQELAYVEVDAEDELVEIFLEEARELFDSLDHALSQWRQSPEDNAPVADLQRTLHTLKGGARLAGITPVGDLGHAFESLLTEISNGQMATTDAVQRLAQQVADRLSSQIDEVTESGRVHEAKPLIAQLQQLLAGELASAMPTTDSYEEAEATAVTDVDGQAAEAPAVEQSLDDGVDAEQQAVTPGEQERVAVLETARQVPESVALEDQHSFETEGAEVVNLFGAEAERETPPESEGPQEAETKSLPTSVTEQIEERPAPPKPLAEAPPAESKQPTKHEQVRVRSDVLDRLVNNAGEVSIYRARLEQQNSAIGFNLSELEQTVARLRQQLRQLEMETEAQILFRYEREKEETGTSEEVFDPLELDRFSTMQQVSRSLMETVNDLISIKDLIEDLHRETETLLMQQSRVSTDLQDGLLRTRMVPFTQVVSRLQRLVRQTCGSVHKQAELTVSGAGVEVDRSILERMVAPLEHILRNAVSHGIETPEKREEQGKKPKGTITLDLSREGTDVVLLVADDGQGLKLENIRKQAIAKGLLEEGADVADSDVMQFILEPGFSTADKVSQIAGRGVGMDVVVSEVKQLSGSLEIKSEEGVGTTFIIRLPLTLAISEALLVKMEEDIYAVPHTSIEGVVRVSREELQDCYEGRQEGFEYAGHTYLVRYLGSMLGIGAISLPEGKKWFPMLLVRSGDRRVAVQVDGLLGNRQIVVKSVGPQLSTVRWITGGTILGDGRVALILDVNAMVRMDAAKPLAPAGTEVGISADAAPARVMVVDDSITVRKVTGRLLERHNFQVTTAKDGVDAVALLQDHVPDLMLLDIEMPRMDGFELARHMRSSPDLKDIPIIMITSRTGEKHRNLAKELGVRGYLGKPYQEMELLENIYSLLAEAQA